MSNDDTKPTAFGPEDYEAVKTGIMQAFEQAAAEGAAQPAVTAETVRLMGEAFERWERSKGLNVLQFPSGQVARQSGDTGEPE